MQRPDRKNKAPEKYVLLLVVVVGVLVASAVFLLNRTLSRDEGARDEGVQVPLSTTGQGEAVEINSLEDLDRLDHATVVRLQERSHQAAASAVGLPPVTGTVTERPDYVSPVEWQVLKAVASQEADSDQALARLVYKLRFSKQWELWQSSQAGVQRDALARQLLEDIPQQVASRDLARGDAQQLQQQILTQLYPDAGLRQQRLAEEAERIDVEFDIQ